MLNTLTPSGVKTIGAFTRSNIEPLHTSMFILTLKAGAKQ